MVRSVGPDGESGCVRTVMTALFRLWLAALVLALTVVVGDLQPVRWLRAHSVWVIVPFAVLTLAILTVDFADYLLTRPDRRGRL
jgi:hypothetical protein